MKHLSSFPKYLSILFVVLFIINISGCNMSRSTSIPSQNPPQSTETQAKPPQTSPLFWEDCIPADGSDNIYELHTDFLSQNGYSDCKRYGDDLLLIGMYTLDDEDLPDGNEEEGSEEGTFYFRFALYDLWQNTLTASINTEAMKVDLYQVVNSQLFLSDYTDNILYRYDEKLSLIGQYDLSGLTDISDCQLSPSTDPDSFFMTDSLDHTIVKITFTEDDYSTDTMSLDCYDPTIYGCTPDGSRLLLSTVNSSTFRSEMILLDTDTPNILDSFSSDSYLWYVSNDALLYMSDPEQNLWTYRDFSTDPSYIQIPQDSTAYLIEDFLLIINNSSMGDDPDYSGFCYDTAGRIRSAFTYELPDSATYICIPPVFFPEYDCCMLIAFAEDLTSYLLVWDMSEIGNASKNLPLYSSLEDIPKLEADEADISDTETPYGDTVTLISDPDAYDWGDLEEINRRAFALEEQYDISIYLGPEVPEYIDYYHTKQTLDAALLSKSLDQLEEILNCYPKNFFFQLCYGNLKGIRIYLAGSLETSSSDLVSDAAGFVSEINDHMVMALNCDHYEDWSYTVNHEISHMIDRSLAFRSSYLSDPVFSETTWASYNPESFSYAGTYEDYESNPDYYDYADYFLDSYGMTFATEDRAELFGASMSHYLTDGSFSYVFEYSPIRLQKLQYYCDCIRADFDSSGWAETLPWEAVVELY